MNPAPSATARSNGPEYAGYELPGQSRRQNAAAFDRYLLERDLAGANRLTVSVLVIREQLDASGLLRECVLERRRGAFDGPYFGNVARVEFVGAATRVRRYRALPDGRLAELPAGEPEADPPAADDVDFSGDDAAVRAALGSDVVIVDRRTPSLPEDLAGLSAVIHARRADGVEVGCGIGTTDSFAAVCVKVLPLPPFTATRPRPISSSRMARTSPSECMLLASCATVSAPCTMISSERARGCSLRCLRPISCWPAAVFTGTSVSRMTPPRC